MSQRKTKIIAFHISAGTYKSFDGALKEANAIKIWLQRLCVQKDYACKAIIGVSQNNPSVGAITAEKKIGRGRPSSIFKRTSLMMKPSTTEPHIHIILFANPASMITSLLARHLNNKHKRKVCFFADCCDYTEEAVSYVMRQSLKLRSVEYDPTALLNTEPWGFYTAVERGNADAKSQRISFTKATMPASSKSPAKSAFHATIKTAPTLQYNTQYIYRTSIRYIDRYLSTLWLKCSCYRKRLPINKLYLYVIMIKYVYL